MSDNTGVGSQKDRIGWREAHRKGKHLAMDHRADRANIERHRGNQREDAKNAKERKRKGYNPLTFFRW